MGRFDQWAKVPTPSQTANTLPAESKTDKEPNGNAPVSGSDVGQAMSPHVTGSPYEVVYEVVAMRLNPSPTAPACGRKEKGNIVRLFDWDPTFKWRKFYDHDTYDSGWMMLDHPKFGPLLRPQNFPFSVKPLEPLCVAVMEKNTNDIITLLEAKADVNVQNPGGLTPLMLAAESDRLDYVVMFLNAGADRSVRSTLGKTALDMAASPSMENLIRALCCYEEFQYEHFKIAIDSLEPPLQDLAYRLFEARTTPQPKSIAVAPQMEVRCAPTAEPLTAVALALPVLVDEVRFAGTYEVVYDKVAMRLEPKPSSPACGVKKKGAIIELYEWDESLKWRRFYDSVTFDEGWMMLDHCEFGPLLRPKDMPLSTSEPLDPIWVAARENNLRDIRRFIEDNMNVDIPDRGRMTPLMLCAELGHYNCTVLLLGAGGGTSNLRINRLKPPMKCLIWALTGQEYVEAEFEGVKSVLQHDVLQVAAKLFATKWGKPM